MCVHVQTWSLHSKNSLCIHYEQMASSLQVQWTQILPVKHLVLLCYRQRWYHFLKVPVDHLCPWTFTMPANSVPYEYLQFRQIVAMCLVYIVNIMPNNNHVALLYASLFCNHTSTACAGLSKLKTVMCIRGITFLISSEWMRVLITRPWSWFMLWCFLMKSASFFSCNT